MLVGCAGLCAAGVVLLVQSSGRFRQEGAATPPSLTSWESHAAPKYELTAHLRPGAGELRDGLAEAWRVLGERRVARINAQGTLVRALRTGHVFASRITLSYERSAEHEEASLVVVRRDADPVTFSVTLEDGQLASIGAEPGVSEGSRDVLAIPVDVAQALAGGQLPPIGIGDLILQDLVILSNALREADGSLLGVLDGLGADPQLVIETPPSSDDGPAGDGASSDPNLAASALVYLEPASFKLKAVRVFNRADRLVRVYADFVYPDAADQPGAAGFQVRSIVTGSHSVFRLDHLELDD